MLSMIVLCRRASHHEFSDAFVAGPAMQDMQKRTEVLGDSEIDARGYDKIRSRIEVETRGGPDNPIGDADLEAKFKMRAEGAISEAAQDKLLGLAWEVDRLPQIETLIDQLVFDTTEAAVPPRRALTDPPPRNDAAALKRDLPDAGRAAEALGTARRRARRDHCRRRRQSVSGTGLNDG